MDFLKVESFILDTLFPISCLSCGKDGEWVCENCLSKVTLRDEQVCPYCEKAITPDGKTCFGCKERYSLDSLLVAAPYSKGPVAGIIHNYKYRFASDLAGPLGKILIKRILSSEIGLPEIIIPVPLHNLRLRWRGFNQSELLAEYVGKNILPGSEIPVLKNSLVRDRYTLPQMKIKNNSERRKNTENAFSVKDKEKIKNKKIWLIDDVSTTGSTLFECAKTLKKSGAKEVFGIVISRQDMKS